MWLWVAEWVQTLRARGVGAWPSSFWSPTMSDQSITNMQHSMLRSRSSKEMLNPQGRFSWHFWRTHGLIWDYSNDVQSYWCHGLRTQMAKIVPSWHGGAEIVQDASISFTFPNASSRRPCIPLQRIYRVCLFWPLLHCELFHLDLETDLLWFAHVLARPSTCSTCVHSCNSYFGKKAVLERGTEKGRFVYVAKTWKLGTFSDLQRMGIFFNNDIPTWTSGSGSWWVMCIHVHPQIFNDFQNLGSS